MTTLEELAAELRTAEAAEKLAQAAQAKAFEEWQRLKAIAENATVASHSARVRLVELARKGPTGINPAAREGPAGPNEGFIADLLMNRMTLMPTAEQLETAKWRQEAQDPTR